MGSRETKVLRGGKGKCEKAGLVGRKQRKSWVMGSCRLKVKGWDESSTKVLGCAGGGVVPEGIVMYQSYAQQKFNRLWALEHK